MHTQCLFRTGVGPYHGYRIPALAQDKIYHFLEGVK